MSESKPPVVGVIHEPIWQSKSGDAGYIVSYVPKGDGDPHMNMAKGEGRYYCRSGSSFIRMEPYMIADRFHKRPQPRLEFTHRLEWKGQQNEGAYIFNRVDLIVGIRNEGLGIALYPALGVSVPDQFSSDFYGVDGNRGTGLPKRPLAHDRPDRQYRFYAGGSNDAVHPGTDIEVDRLSVKIPPQAAVFPDIEIKYDARCDGFSGQGQVTIPGAHLLKMRGY